MDFAAVTAALGELIIERLPDGRFVRRGAPPPWCSALGVPALLDGSAFDAADVFPFLEIFLPDAERCWGSESAACLGSDFWTEMGTGGEEIHLEASAVRIDSRKVLVITRNERLFSQQELVLQRARELRLTHHDLTREMEQKDILVHSIVHDLAAPLHGILGALSLLAELPLDLEGRKWTELALQAAKRQRHLISDILDVFSAEYGALTSVPDPSNAPDLAKAINVVVTQAQPAASMNQTEITTNIEEGPLRVLAEETRLERVLANLVDNALRHSPTGARVTVSAIREAHTIRVNVDDDGPGTPPEVLPHLFELFAKSRSAVSGTGLGLYFCRITVERWGGGIGYERRDGGGSRFWIRLVDVLRRRRYG